MWFLYPLLAALSGYVNRRPEISDFRLFGQVGEQLLRGNLDEVYADPIVQAGALELLLFPPLHALDGMIPGLGRTVYLTVGPAIAVLTLMAVVRWLCRLTSVADPRVAVALCGALALVWDIPLTSVDTGHPAEFTIPVLWLVAAVAARRNHVVLGGFLVGCAAGWELWGLLATPVLILAPGPRRVALGAASLLCTVSALFVPFMITGHFEMLAFSWKVDPDTLPGLFMADPRGGFTWWWRLAQAGLSALTCLVVARQLRRGWDAVWLAPLAAVAVRLVFEPVHAAYYWLPAQYLALWGLAVAGRTRGRTAVVVAALCWWFATPPGLTWLGTALVSVPAVAWLVRELARSGQVPAPDGADRIPGPRRPVEDGLDQSTSGSVRLG
jgi:hypothetical protein